MRAVVLCPVQDPRIADGGQQAHAPKLHEFERMKLIKNTGNDHAMDTLRAGLAPTSKLDIVTPAFSVVAFPEFGTQLQDLAACRLVLPGDAQTDLQLLGSDSDRAFRNQFTARWLARQCADWLGKRAEVRNTQTPLPQSSLISTAPEAASSLAITGHCPFTTDGLGLTPGNSFSLIQSSKPRTNAVPSLDHWEKDWQENPQRTAQPKLLPVDFRSALLRSCNRVLIEN